MTIVEAVEQSYPNGWVEDRLCAELAKQPVNNVPLVRFEHQTTISGALIEWSLTQPEDDSLIIDDRPIVIENGLCGSDEAYVSLVHSLTNHGYKVLAKTPPRHQRPDLAYNPYNLLHPMELQAKATWGVMRDYMRRYPTIFKNDPQGFHLVGHSMGGPVAASVAEHHKEHVASVTLIGSAGLEKHHTPRMAARLGKVAVKELTPALLLPGRISNTKLAMASLKHVASVLNRTAREAVQVSNHYSVPILKNLKSMGIPLYNIQPEHDHFFPYDKQLGIIHLFDRFIKFNFGRADHLIPQTQPDLTAAVIADLLSEPDFNSLIAV